jgi:uncharacterized membrane protein YphA (DoxX/SURF4 family)
MPKTNAPGSLVILQLALGLFFILTGLEVLMYYQSLFGSLEKTLANFFGNTQQVIANVIAVVEIVSGAILIISLLIPMGRGAFNFIVLLIFILWIAWIVYFDFIAKAVFQPNWLTWLKELALHIIVLIGIWATRARSSN